MQLLGVQPVKQKWSNGGKKGEKGREIQTTGCQTNSLAGRRHYQTGLDQWTSGPVLFSGGQPDTITRGSSKALWKTLKSLACRSASLRGPVIYKFSGLYYLIRDFNDEIPTTNATVLCHQEKNYLRDSNEKCHKPVPCTLLQQVEAESPKK